MFLQKQFRSGLSLSVLCATSTAFAATYDPVAGYVGEQIEMRASDAGAADASPLIFDITKGHFASATGNQQTFRNAQVVIRNLSMNNGNGSGVTTFTGDISGEGAIRLTTFGLGQDFVFAGGMQAYAGDITIDYRAGANPALAGSQSSVVQFGGNVAGGTVARGNVTADATGNRIDQVLGTGALTVNNLVLNYATSTDYDRLVANNTIIALQVVNKGAAAVRLTGEVTGRHANASNNAILIQAGLTEFTGAVTNFGTLELTGGGVAFAHDTTFGTELSVEESSVLTIGAGRTVTAGGLVTLAAGKTLTLNTGTLAITSHRAQRLDGYLAGDGALRKAGAGTLTLGAANTHTGGTGVNGGTLVTGDTSALGAGDVNVVAGTLQIGDGATNTVTLGAGADLILGDGAVLKFFGDDSRIVLAGDGTYAFGDSILDLGGLFNAEGVYELITGGTVNLGTQGELTFLNFDHDKYRVSFSNGRLHVIPEPSTYGLMGAGALGAIALVRRRRKAAKQAA